MGSINPKDEVAAYTAAIDARLMTRERAEWELGGTDWNATFKLHAPQQTTVQGRIVGGTVVDLQVTPASRRKDVVLPQ